MTADVHFAVSSLLIPGFSFVLSTNTPLCVRIWGVFGLSARRKCNGKVRAEVARLRRKLSEREGMR